MKDTLKDLKERRSIRSYRPDQIREEELDAILEAGMYAPSGMGAQPVVMVAIQDPDTIRTLSEMNAKIMGGEGDPFYGAPTVIVVLADRKRGTCVEDGSLVMGNLMNAAQALGIGSCWIHRAKEEFDSQEGRALLEKWGLQGDYRGIGHCILGYPAGEKPKPKPRKENFVVKVK